MNKISLAGNAIHSPSLVIFALLGLARASSISAVPLFPNCRSCTKHEELHSVLGDFADGQYMQHELKRFRQRSTLHSALDVDFPIKQGNFALSRSDKQLVKRALADARDLAQIAVRILQSPLGRSDEENDFINKAFYELFARAYKSDMSILKKQVADAFSSAVSIFLDGVAVRWADSHASKCRCQDGRNMIFHAMGDCMDRTRLGAFVSFHGDQVDRDSMGRPVFHICAWAVRQRKELSLIILHEALHVADSNIKDQSLDDGEKAYGMENCKKLAAQKDGRPLLNADSYVEFLNAVLTFRAQKRQQRDAAHAKAALYRSFNYPRGVDL